MRKPPVRHTVSSHKRQGKTIQSYSRGSGRRRIKRVVGEEGERPVSVHRLNYVIRQLEKYKDPAFSLWCSMVPDLHKSFNIDVENKNIKYGRSYRSGSIAVRPSRISVHVPIHRRNFDEWKKRMISAGCHSVIWHEVFREGDPLPDILFAHALCEYPNINKALQEVLTLT